MAYLGHEVTCIDTDEERISLLLDGQVPIHEPHLQRLFDAVSSRMVFFSEYTPEAVQSAAILICVGTPASPNGDADVRNVERAATSIAEVLEAFPKCLIVTKSTVPVGSAQRVRSIVDAVLRDRGVDCRVVTASNPEFLREGAALSDAFYPDRIVIGANDVWAINTLRQIYLPILEQSFVPPPGLPRREGQPLPLLVTMTPTSAEMVKYASNLFLAMKISYANEIAGVADRVGADVTEVMRAVGLDQRISSRYLGAGVGWGGSCFGKDIKALLALGAQYGHELPLSQATLTVNERQRQVVVEKLQAHLKVIRGSTIALWGLAFKPGTDDVRNAPSIGIAKRLIDLGAHVKAYDPVAMNEAERSHPQLPIEYAPSSVEAARGADAIVLVTEWDEFLHVDWRRVAEVVRNRLYIDGRNVTEPMLVAEHGFTYVGIGR